MSADALVPRPASRSLLLPLWVPRHLQLSEPRLPLGLGVPGDMMLPRPSREPSEPSLLQAGPLAAVVPCGTPLGWHQHQLPPPAWLTSPGMASRNAALASLRSQVCSQEMHTKEDRSVSSLVA